MQKQWKNKKANQQNPKKNKSKIKTEKRGKKTKWKKTWKNGLVHLHLFCIYFVFSIVFCCFYFAFILFFAWKKAHNMQNKSKKQIEKTKYRNAKQMQMDKSIFSPCFFPS